MKYVIKFLKYIIAFIALLAMLIAFVISGVFALIGIFGPLLTRNPLCFVFIAIAAVCAWCGYSFLDWFNIIVDRWDL